jgi:hypothetical protein
LFLCTSPSKFNTIFKYLNNKDGWCIFLCSMSLLKACTNIYIIQVTHKHICHMFPSPSLLGALSRTWHYKVTSYQDLRQANNCFISLAHELIGVFIKWFWTVHDTGACEICFYICMVVW